MAVYSGATLSHSTNGRPIPIAATSTPGTAIHSCGSSGFDEVYIWVSNVTAAAATLTVEWGGTNNPGDHMVSAYVVPANSIPIPISLGQRIQGGVTVRAFSSTGSALNITGYANLVR